MAAKKVKIWAFLFVLCTSCSNFAVCKIEIIKQNKK